MNLKSFLSGSYSGRSLTIDCQETMNWYPEVSEEPIKSNGGSDDDSGLISLIPCPGLILFTNLARSTSTSPEVPEDSVGLIIFGNDQYEMSDQVSKYNAIIN